MIHFRKLYSKKEKKEFILGCICISILSIYALVMLLLFIHTEAVVPDEVWFWWVANEQSVSCVSDYFNMHNELGYGAFYWLILHILVDRLVTRLFSWLFLITVPICVVSVLKYYLKRSWLDVITALIVYLSSPMAWFTGKIIGPELMGNAIGTVGVTFFLLKLTRVNDEFYQKKKYKVMIVSAYTFLASIICGIAVGIKLYNIVFAVFISFVVFSDSFEIIIQEHLVRKWIGYLLVNAVAVVLGCVIGFFLCNPFAFTSMDIYVDNLGRFTATSHDIGEYIRRLNAMVFNELIEWDLVNAGGMIHTIVSLVGLVGLIIVGVCNKKSRNTAIISACTILSFALILSTSPVFAGWYLIPMLFFIPIMVNRSIVCWIVVVLNLVIMYPDVNYQVQSKVQHIKNVSNQEEIYELMCVQKIKYKDYYPLYYVDVNMNSFIMHFPSDHMLDEDEVLFISERALANLCVKQYYEYAINEENGFRVVDKNEYFTTVLYKAK